MRRCFSSLSEEEEEEEASAYFYGNLSDSDTHLRRKSRMQSEGEKRALSNKRQLLTDSVQVMDPGSEGSVPIFFAPAG